MNIKLEIFSPIELFELNVSSTYQTDLREHLIDADWEAKLFDDLQLDSDFKALYETFSRTLSSEFLEQHMLMTLEQSNIALHEVEISMQVTGLAMLSVTYNITIESDTVFSASNSYDALTKYSDSHFIKLYKIIKIHASEISGLNRFKIRNRMQWLRHSSKDEPHWTHGVYSHIAKEGAAVLDQNTLTQFVGKNSREYSYQLFLRSEFKKSFQVDSRPSQVRTCFGWEKTAISTESGRELQNFTYLIKQMGYIWQTHYLISSLTINKVKKLNQKFSVSNLGEAREFRRDVAILLSACQQPQISMNDRYMHITALTSEQWSLEGLRNSVESNIAVFSLIFQQLEGRRDEMNNRRLSTVVAILSVMTLISVTTDIAIYVKKFGPLHWSDWAIIFHEADFYTMSSILGWPIIFLSIYGLFSLYRKIFSR